MNKLCAFCIKKINQFVTESFSFKMFWNYGCERQKVLPWCKLFYHFGVTDANDIGNGDKFSRPQITIFDFHDP